MRPRVIAAALGLSALLAPSAAVAQERDRLPSISIEPEKRIGVGDKILGEYVWPNPVDPATGEVRQTYREEVDFLRSWSRERAAWIDANVDGLGQ